MAQIKFTTNDMIPSILNAQGNPRFWIIAFVASEYISPPNPDPEAPMPLARLRFVVNHCGMIPTEPTNKKPMPHPKQTPWLRKSCHISFAKDAPMKEMVWKNTPSSSVVFVPKSLVIVVAMGDMSSAIEIDNPPTNAKSILVAPGNLLVDR
jgi:hypothetical protein